MTLYQLFLLDRASEALLPPNARKQPSDIDRLVAAARMVN